MIHAQIFMRQNESIISSQSADSRSVNIIDVNQDGWEDVFISNGPSNGANNELYLNKGEGIFRLAPVNPIVLDSAKSDGATFADVDNDGDLDAYVVTWYGDENNFYLNQGDGNFVHTTDAGLNAPGSFAEAAAFGDYNQDGFVDLFVTTSGGREKTNLLFLNTGKGLFLQAIAPGLTDVANTSRSVNWVDVDLDNDLDLFIANENGEGNALYINGGGQSANFVIKQNDVIARSPKSSISGSWGDVDNDGDQDLFVANSGYFKELNNQLFINDGHGSFSLMLEGVAVKDGGCSYGSAFGDVDNDGDLDLLVSNGFSESNLADRLYLNDGAGHFSLAANAFSEMPEYCSFGAAFGDLDNDGFLDLVIAHCNNNTKLERENSVYRNQGNENQWIKFSLEGQTSNRSAIGARIQVTTKSRGKMIHQTRVIESQSGYCGQNSMIAHFGLKSEKDVLEVRIFWPSGQISMLENLESNQQYHIRESDQNALTIFPNKEAGTLFLQLHDPTQKLKENPRLVLQDENGTLVFSEDLHQNDQGDWMFTLKSALERGVYLLRIEFGKKTYLQRLII